MKVKWGVLGTANIAKNCTIPGMQLADSCELYAIAGRSMDKARAYQKEFGFAKAYGGYDELLDDSEVQAVYIPLPNDLHKKWVMEALEKKKHVLCEKPLALNEDEAKEMFACAQRNGVYLMEAYAYQHSPYVKSLKKDLADGVIGEVDYIESAFLTQCYKNDIRLHKAQGGGAMYDLGCYCTTMILSLIESDPIFVKAVGEISGDDVDYMTTALIKFSNGVRASFNVGMTLGEDTDDRYDRLYIHGSKGSIISYVEYNQAGEVSYEIHTNDGIIQRKVTVPQNYSLEIEQLSKCVLKEDIPFITPEFSMKNLRLMDKIFDEIGYYIR
ncbi:MAG: Gfo/Idh/MocA family oxidoreductase [Pseudobutyrivibrio sp.]|nr:Gfo/Idh/MocA family oxidoreductase [Pseudobutyrivibrio sp.]